MISNVLPFLDSKPVGFPEVCPFNGLAFTGCAYRGGRGVCDGSAALFGRVVSGKSPALAEDYPGYGGRPPLWQKCKDIWDMVNMSHVRL